MTDIVFLSAVRTGFGTFGGALKDHSATDLGVIAAEAALARAGLDARLVDHAIVGNAMQTSRDAMYCARHVALRAGLAVETPAVTVNRLCGSGFEAVVQGAHRLTLGEATAVLAGGTESMSQAPHVVRGARWGIKYGPSPLLEDSLFEGLTDSFGGCAMADTAENLAQRYGITREACEAWALVSQQRAAAAWASGVFAPEVVPVMLRDRKTKQDVPWARDEHIRGDMTPEGLAKLPPVTRAGGTVTAGTASGINDGAAMLVMTTAETAAREGAAPIGRLVSWGVMGVPPAIMGIGPVPAARQALARAGMTMDQMELVEINEAFAAQYLAVARDLELDPARTNVHGGAIAIGHPLGASGARLTAHLLHALRARGGGIGLGAACIGGGQGIAVIVEGFGG
ncbi:MAG: acetyl-CoA C-acyltransferase [Gemmatimonadales bacterium]|nr:acetyl-CoA C-acyltransferase [Gemmatimonadales bacterium]MBP7620617.1 acetyl-CoA C-acyltransferase [Gemmatimonadales bacterium]